MRWNRAKQWGSGEVVFGASYSLCKWNKAELMPTLLLFPPHKGIKQLPSSSGHRRIPPSHTHTYNIYSYVAKCWADFKSPSQVQKLEYRQHHLSTLPHETANCATIKNHSTLTSSRFFSSFMPSGIPSIADNRKPEPKPNPFYWLCKFVQLSNNVAHSASNTQYQAFGWKAHSHNDIWYKHA